MPLKPVARKLVPEAIVRKLLFHNSPEIAALVKKNFGDIQGATTEQMRNWYKLSEIALPNS